MVPIAKSAKSSRDSRYEARVSRVRREIVTHRLTPAHKTELNLHPAHKAGLADEHGTPLRDFCLHCGSRDHMDMRYDECSSRDKSLYKYQTHAMAAETGHVR